MGIPLEQGFEADLWRLYEFLYGHRTSPCGPGVAVDGAIEVIRAWRERGEPAERALKDAGRTKYKAVGFVDYRGDAHWEPGRLPKHDALLYVIER